MEKIFTFWSLMMVVSISLLGSSNCFSFQSKYYGEPCSFGCDTISLLACKNGTCGCYSTTEFSYSENGEPTCKFGSIFAKCPKYSCGEDQYCESGKCFCNESKIMINKNCTHAVKQEPMESCYVSKTNETAYICDPEKYSFCKSSLCVCFPNYFYNSTSLQCELKSDSPLYKKDGYKAQPEEYCLQTSDCLDGLRCLDNFTCDCPSQCKYIQADEICDCGVVQLKTPQGPIWVGVFLGLLSVAFWFHVIRKSYNDKCFNEVSLSSHLPLDETDFAAKEDVLPQVPEAPKDLPPSYAEANAHSPFFPPQPTGQFSAWNVTPTAPQPSAPTDSTQASALHPQQTDSATPLNSTSPFPGPEVGASSPPPPAASYHPPPNPDLPYPPKSNFPIPPPSNANPP